jgi:hypothetical protein
VWHAKPRHKFIALDCGTSGAFLVENKTGEIFNIKGYGQADYNKKAKADLGNIRIADPEFVHARRWNYLQPGVRAIVDGMLEMFGNKNKSV